MKEVQEDTLNRLVEAEGYHERVPEFGERAWRVKGKLADIIYWDMGNGWCDIINVILKRGSRAWLQQFFEKIEESENI